ncbi:MAG: carbamoyltransferase HypF [Gemmatimonadales bacterium]
MIPAERAAARVRVTGLVQGVGFRPFVHRLALRHHLGGWVRNASGEVQIEIEGIELDLTTFLEELRADAPPLARIEEVGVDRHEPEGLEGFSVIESLAEPNRRQPVSADVATCPACERELFDESDRRYRYPFITCTDCGPRFTIIDEMPYDRERTSMRAFAQCPDCLAEYQTPGDRRHHSETNSCHRCGPRLELVIPDRVRITGNAPALARAVTLLRSGAIVAVRGLGGFHLAVDATNDRAVRRLRSRKRREAKPFAVMVRTIEAARDLAELTEAEAAQLATPERPVVLVRARADSPIAPAVAPGLAWIGLMLPSTPLHHLLLEGAGRPLVMTSGNLSEEPIAIGNEEALERLGRIADGFLLHDREILARYDDSVVRLVRDRRVFLRRARGFAPMPQSLPLAAPRPILAVGPHLKSTFTLAVERRAFVSQHQGDLDSLETLEQFRLSLDGYQRLFRVRPEVVAHDAHPGYLSTRIAGELGLEAVAVQHHHAHVAAVLAEHGETGPVIGVAFDGTGYGADGTVWGAEVLIADLRDYRRVAHFLPAPLPGGDAAARAPWRAALGYLSLDPPCAPSFAAAFAGIARADRALVERQIAARINSPLASSMGRLFDAAAAVLGVRQVSSFEGQAAMELESLAGRRSAAEHPGRIDVIDGILVADPLPILAAIGWRLQRGDDRADLAADFHASVARTTEELVRQIAESSALSTVALAGGCFQNARLLESLSTRLTRLGLRVLAPRALSPNDGAISYGQAAVAAARLAAGDASAILPTTPP